MYIMIKYDLSVVKYYSILQYSIIMCVGQFWNMDVTAHSSDTSLGEGTLPYVVNVKHPQAQLRSFLADHYSHVWDGSPKPCLYAGSSQGGSISDVEPHDPVLEGSYHEYEVNSLFDHQFK